MFSRDDYDDLMSDQGVIQPDFDDPETGNDFGRENSLKTLTV